MRLHVLRTWQERSELNSSAAAPIRIHLGKPKNAKMPPIRTLFAVLLNSLSCRGLVDNPL
jgi:hypothetical protein